jgi:glutathione S-transferase
VPVLVGADGFTLYECRAICKYLATKYSIPLLPPHSDIEATALFDQAQSVETIYFAEPAGRIGFEMIVKKFMGLPTDEAILSEAVKSVEMFFDVSEGLLKDRDFMAGNEFTLVDIYYIPFIQKLFAIGYGNIIVNHEAVHAWWERCVNRPAVKKLLDADKEAAAAMGKK